jgi:hypothetical protein
MANHGWLPRSGRDIDLASLQHAVVGAFNYAPHAFDGAFQAAIDFNLSTTGNPSTIHLADLAKHDAIEFDGSLSRNDYALGDNLHFDPAIWHTVAQYLGLYRTGPSKADKYVTVETAARARAQRVRDAMRANPHFNASTNEMFGSPGTTALYLTTLWDDKADAAPKAWIRAFFGMCVCFASLCPSSWRWFQKKFFLSTPHTHMSNAPADADAKIVPQRRSASRIARVTKHLKRREAMTPSTPCLPGSRPCRCQ